MEKISKILSFGGSCPTQLDAITSDKRMIYGRYRWGHLTVQIGPVKDLSDFAAVDGELLLSKYIGGKYDGCMSLQQFKENTKEILDFSEASYMLKP